VAARCETVLNTTMAEFETYHAQKLEDFERLTVDHLDGEIEFYEQVLSRLRTARANFVSPQWEELSENPRQPSMYERDLAKPRLTSLPLPEPCPHVWDSAPMRPVSVALQEGVGMLFGSTGSLYGGRGSVFGKFW
jgi:sorting nexin-9/18/33